MPSAEAECARRPIEQELSAGALGAAGARPPYYYHFKVYYVLCVLFIIVRLISVINKQKCKHNTIFRQTRRRASDFLAAPNKRN